MKLSLKFFCIAYLVVLLSAGTVCAYIIHSVNNSLWSVQVERVNTAVNYAAESFMSFADVSNSDIAGGQKYILRQIRNTLDGAVTDIALRTEETVMQTFGDLEDNRCGSRFLEREGRLLMESVCRLRVGEDAYYLAVYADFTAVSEQCDLFWDWYGLAVFGVATVSGLLLLLLSRRVTKPLAQLAKATDEIAMGNYGEQVRVHSSSDEIAALSDSFNAMSSAIERNIREIRAATERRDRFVSNFTHELKTPMTAIIGYAQLLQSYDLDEREKQAAAAVIDKEAKRLEKLSLQLLELYVFQNDEVDMGAVPLAGLEEQLRAILEVLAEKYDVRCHVALGSGTVWGNEPLLLSLLYNLADNACKASAPQAAVIVTAIRQAGAVTLCVKDTGRGIAGEHIHLLTEPFYREDKSRSRKLGGAGLGLSLCKEIAAIHGTALTFESEPGKGTTVSFVLNERGAEDA